MRVKKITSVEFALRIRPLEVGQFMLLISGVGWPEAKIQSRIVSHLGHHDEEEEEKDHDHDHDGEEGGEEANGDDGDDNGTEYVTWMPYSSEE